MDWRGRAAATGARAKRQGSRQAACAAQKCSVGQTECQTHFEIMGQEQQRERRGRQGAQASKQKRWDVGRELEGTEYRERGVEGLAGEGFGCVCVCVCSGAEAGLRVCGCACVKVVCLP